MVPVLLPNRLGGGALGQDMWRNGISSHGLACDPWGRYTTTPSVCRGPNAQIKVVGRLGLSYRTANQLNDIIDKNMPGLPPFECQKLKIGHECLDFHHRDTLQCIRSLYGNPDLLQHLVFAPERHYTDHEQTCRILNEMHTGDWWWSTQVCTVKFNENLR